MTEDFEDRGSCRVVWLTREQARQYGVTHGQLVSLAIGKPCPVVIPDTASALNRHKAPGPLATVRIINLVRKPESKKAEKPPYDPFPNAGMYEAGSGV